MTLAAGDRRPEPLVVADDPVRQVAAVRAAGHAEPVRVGEAVRDERVDPREDVAGRAGAPVAVVRVVEGLAVALRAARVASRRRRSPPPASTWNSQYGDQP